MTGPSRSTSGGAPELSSRPTEGYGSGDVCLGYSSLYVSSGGERRRRFPSFIACDACIKAATKAIPLGMARKRIGMKREGCLEMDPGLDRLW